MDLPEYVSAAIPNILSGIVMLLAGAAFGALGTVVANRRQKSKEFAQEHTDLVCHLDESKELNEKVDKLSDEIKELRESQEPQNAVLRELMGIQLDKEHKRLVEQGYATPEEKRNYERMYLPYHGIFGNGTRTFGFEDVMSMHSYPTN